MLRTKIYGKAAARVLIILVLLVLLPLFFILYVICQLGEAFLNVTATFIADTKRLLIEWDEQLKPNEQ